MEKSIQIPKGYVLFELEDYIQNPVALARIRAHCTQEALAEHLEVTPAYIRKVENQATVSPPLLQKMTKAIKTLSRKTC